MKQILLFGMMLIASISFAQNTNCAGTSTETTDGENLTLGYTYSFATSGTDVNISFKLLDDKVGIVAYLWDRTNGFNEMSMTTTDGVSTITLSEQTDGAILTFACKFAFANGLSVTKDFTYTVGDNCTALGIESNDLSNLKIFANNGILNVNCNKDLINGKIEVYSLTGQEVVSKTISKANEKLKINNGLYIIRISDRNNKQILSQKVFSN